MTTSIAAMENGVITPETKIRDKGVFTKYSSAGLTLKCMVYNLYGATHHTINVTDALMYSCNYFYYTVGDKLNINDLDKVAKAMGLGESTGVELPESTGYRANPETKKELYSGTDRVWTKGDMLTAVIGQSDNRFTPLQLAVYISTLANRGVRYKATFMKRVVSSDYQNLLAENTPKELSKLNIKDSTLDAIYAGMNKVVENPNGTGFALAWRAIPGHVCGKTSTAEQYWGASDNGAFVCFAPMDDPEIAIAVYIEKGGHGSSLAIIARAIMREYFNMGTVSDVNTYENKLS